MDFKKINFEQYKCFRNGSIDNLKPINVIIGKNNIGKSSILDIIEMIYGKRTFTNTKITLEKDLTEEDILPAFRKDTSGGGLPGTSHYEYGKQFIGETFMFEVYRNGNDIAKRMYEKINEYNSKYKSEYNQYWGTLANSIKYKQKGIKRILAERNIFPETESEDMSVDENGNGITTIINNFINKSQYDESLVRINLLNKLNEIMGEDITFTEIVTQQIKINDINKWEIFLREEEKGRVSLSASGSGLKTILMVLVYTILIPNIEKVDLSDYIFMFEELENNLHPSLQRRLLKYIEELTCNNATFFLTTHSNVLLDNFQNNENINIIHVLKNEDKYITTLNASNDIQRNSILNDLGIKASDLLQSNGIIWVEGPSDRIYINKWIELWSDGKLKEGKNYQCVFYGGRLLSNLTLSEENELISLLKVNRNSLIVIDSDKKNPQSQINNTKKRILSEALNNNIFCWITKGREIENYIPDYLVKKIYGLENSDKVFEQYQNLDNFLDELQEGLGKSFLRSKIEFAKKVVDNTQFDDFKDVYDLNSNITKVINCIHKWNNM